MAVTNDWRRSEKRIHAECVAAIERFAREHPREAACFFTFDSNPRYGSVLIAFDTLENNIRTARETERFACESRNRMLCDTDAWKNAKYCLTSPALHAFNTNSGAFAYPEFAKIDLPEWRKAAKQHPAADAAEDDFVESNARLIFWRVTKRLVADADFGGLTLASPFMIGYGIHDQEEVILRILNWPPKA